MSSKYQTLQSNLFPIYNSMKYVYKITLDQQFFIVDCWTWAFLWKGRNNDGFLI